MSNLHEAEATLPELALREMPERTKDFLIAQSTAGKSVVEVVRDVLNKAANAAVFAQPEGGAR